RNSGQVSRHITAALIVAQQSLPIISRLPGCLPVQPLEIGPHTTGRIAVTSKRSAEVERLQSLQQQRAGATIECHMMKINDELEAGRPDAHQRETEQGITQQVSLSVAQRCTQTGQLLLAFLARVVAIMVPGQKFIIIRTFSKYNLQ